MSGRRLLGLSGAVLALVVAGSRLHPRAPGERRVVGFVVGWDAASLRSLEAHADELTHVVVDGFSLGADGRELRDRTALPVLAAARQHRLPVLAMVSNYDSGWQAGRVRHLCATAGTRASFAAALAQEVQRRGFRGVNLDFEGLDPADRAGLSALCACLSRTLGSRGLLLTIDVPVGRSSSAAGAYDLAALSRSCDFVVAMAYDEHGATSQPGPVASRDWALQALAEVRRSMPAAKLIAGVGAYGYDWSQRETSGWRRPATVRGFSDCLTAARSTGAVVRWDAAARAPFFTYMAGGARHAVWFEDAASASSRIAAAARGRFAGVSIWRLGTEDPALWTEIRAYRRRKSLRDNVDRSLSLADVIHLRGEGDFLSVTPGSRGGRRHFTRRHGEVIAEQYPALPAAFLVQRAGLPKHRQVALTFDDGPDPVYTPEVLALLRREQVPAAFFVVGSRAEAYPELVRRIYAEGHDLGNHTYSHLDLAAASPLRARLELNATQRLIEAITGHRTLFFRPPYDTDSRPETRAQLQPLLQASEAGYVTVAAAIDPADWSLRDPGTIVERCLRDGRDGGVIVLHDAGGDRSATIRALPRLIDAFRARGCEFVPLHDLISRSRNTVMPPEELSPWESRAMTLTLLCLHPLATLFAVVALLGLMFSVLRAVIVAPLAAWQFRRHQTRATGGERDIYGMGAARLSPDSTPLTPAVSVLVPAFNEERVIGKTLTHLLASDYPDLEILILDDGSSDGTHAAVAPFLSDSRVRYLRKENSGKGATLNRGIQESRGEILVMLDADTLFEPATISRLVDRFRDPAVGAAAGNIKVGNRRGLLTQWQSLEYVIAINLDKRFFDLLNCVTVVPGSVGAWRRQALEQVGGFSAATLAEDTDLTLAVRRAGWRICYEPSAIAWTEAPATIACLARQRLRWVFGTFQCLWKHRHAFLDPRAGSMGWIAMPYMLIYHVLLLLLGPVMDGAVLGMGFMGHGAYALVLATAFLAAEELLAAVAFSFEREPKWPLLLVPLQRVIYRYIIYWVALKSALCVLKGTHLGWQKAARTGSATVVPLSVLVAGLLWAPPAARAAGPAASGPPAPTVSAEPAPPSDSVAPAPGAHLPAALFDFEEFWDLVDGRGALVGVQAGAYPQPVSDARGRGAAVRSGVSAVTAVSLDRVTTLSLEQFDGETYRPGLAGDTPLHSAWTGLKLTRRVAPGTTVSVLQLAGDATATGLSLGYGRSWRGWEADVGFWASSDTARMRLDTSSTGFDASLTRSVSRTLRVGAGLDGPLVRGQLGSLTLQYAPPDDRSNVSLALRRWYGSTTLLELRGWHRLGQRWEVGATASSEMTVSVFAKHHF